MTHTPIPPEELDVFKRLPRIKTVVDVGARTDTAYLSIRPNAEYHLFEPNPLFFEELRRSAERYPKVFVNGYGLSDMQGEVGYNNGRQAFLGGECPATTKDQTLSLSTLDWYVDATGITQVDFLKVDAEGYDYKVFLGGKETLKISRFIQYEYWDDPLEFEVLLGKDFELVPIGYRNVLGMSKRLVSPYARKKLKEYIEYKGYRRLV